LPVKKCEVCGGPVRPVDDRSAFGYCEDCGLVYVLKDRLKERLGAEPFAALEPGIARDSTETANAEGSSSDSATSARPPGSHWRCPDCGMEIQSDSDSDLGFARREHIREYHPNRSAG